jgi:hypothetical protein
MIVVLARYSTALTCVCVVVSPHLLQTAVGVDITFQISPDRCHWKKDVTRGWRPEGIEHICNDNDHSSHTGDDRQLLTPERANPHQYAGRRQETPVERPRVLTTSHISAAIHTIDPKPAA